jgi:serine/threonine protein kinase
MAPKNPTVEFIASRQLLPASFLRSQYDFVSQIGEGKFGTVWKCQDKKSGAVVVCKEISKAGRSARNIKQEMLYLALAQGHENVVRLEAAYQDSHSLFLLQEHCATGDLLTRVSGTSGMPETEAKRLFRQICSAVAHCHRKGIVHRDIKLENILLTRSKDAASESHVFARLADFGLACRLTPGQKLQGYAGTHPYAAPEVHADEEYSESADIFSLGVVLHAMLEGRWPAFVGGRACAMDEQALAAWEGWEKVSGQARDLIALMLSADPDARPTAEEILCHSWLVEKEGGEAGEGRLCTASVFQKRQFDWSLSLRKGGVQPALPAGSSDSTKGSEGAVRSFTSRGFLQPFRIRAY